MCLTARGEKVKNVPLSPKERESVCEVGRVRERKKRALTVSFAAATGSCQKIAQFKFFNSMFKSEEVPKT